MQYTKELFAILDAEADRSDLLRIADAQRLILAFSVCEIPLEDAKRYLKTYIKKTMPIRKGKKQ